MKKTTHSLKSLLFWSVISAAFIGPGTVTTAAKAGAEFGPDLLWALTFSTIATILLQEAAARITIASGKNLGETISLKFRSKTTRWIRYFVGISVIFGCAAYQAGNILGAVSGISLLSGWDPTIVTLLVGFISGIILWVGKPDTISRFLGLLVAGMGLLFIGVALRSGMPIKEGLTGAIVPRIPEGSGWLMIGLVGTTIVPYNLFLGSGIGKGQEMKTMRQGLVPAVTIGGIISIAILVAAIKLKGEFSFTALAEMLRRDIGNWAAIFFGLGLFAAGFTSAITAPMASAITAQGLFGGENARWSPDSRYFRGVWILVWLVGMIFGLSGIKPIPAIILAQALNGLLLPFVAVFLYLVINDRAFMPERWRNKLPANIALALIVGITFMLGVINLWKALSQV
ncbi:MAG: Nramp family divalent metal transporter [Bacteroidia bacterium]|nr:Nramp family divalent metal transporter [Bacteroidia bacterium]